MADVIQKVIDNNDINNGRCLIYVTQNGIYTTHDVEEKTVSLNDIEDKYTNRFDNYKFY